MIKGARLDNLAIQNYRALAPSGWRKPRAASRLVGVTLKPWRVELELRRRLAVFIADRHLDLGQTFLVENHVFRDYLIEEEQVGRHRIDLIRRQRAFQSERHAAMDEIP